MFNLGFPEIVLISAIVLLIFGPKRLPELAKGLGKGIREFKKALSAPEENEQKAALPKKDGNEPPQNS
jgi:sec-independent protein translocase protein TatA